MLCHELEIRRDKIKSEHKLETRFDVKYSSHKNLYFWIFSHVNLNLDQ